MPVSGDETSRAAYDLGSFMKPEDATRDRKSWQGWRSRSGFLALLAMAIVGALFWFGLWYAAKIR